MRGTFCVVRVGIGFERLVLSSKVFGKAWAANYIIGLLKQRIRGRSHVLFRVDGATFRPPDLRPPNLPTSQPPNLPTSQPHNLLKAIHAMLHSEEPEPNRNEEELIGHIKSIKRGKGFQSVRSQNNLQNALAWFRAGGKSTQRKVVKDFWTKSLEISPEIFLLLASSYGPDTLRRRGRRETENLLIAGRRLKEQTEVTTILSPLVQKSGLAQILHSNGFQSDAVSVPKLSPRAQKVVELLLDVKDMDMMSYVDPSRLSPLSDVDDQTRKIWCETTTGLPITVSSATCWRTRCPSFVEIWTEASKIKAKSSNSPNLVSPCD
jgi:hypothetical protein